MTTSIRRTQVERQIERDQEIQTYHVGEDPQGLKCPLCQRWSPLDFRSPEGVRLTCESCGAVAIMPRVQLARAIKRYR